MADPQAQQQPCSTAFDLVGGFTCLVDGKGMARSHRLWSAFPGEGGLELDNDGFLQLSLSLSGLPSDLIIVGGRKKATAMIRPRRRSRSALGGLVGVNEGND